VCFAEGGTVLVGSAKDAAVFLATPADTVQARSLERLQGLGRGLVVLALDEQIADKLALPSTASAQLRFDLPFTAPIDAAFGVQGGWSTQDRARTMRVAADPTTGPSDLRIPGHVHPVRIPRDRLLAEDSNGSAAALELARVSGRVPVVALCIVVDRTGAPASLTDARRDPNLSHLPVASTVALRGMLRARQVSELAVTCLLPTRYGSFQAVAYAPIAGGDTTVALVYGDPASRTRALVHAHAGCALGDIFGSLRCACRAEFEDSIAAVVAEGAGIVLYTKAAATSPMPTCGRDRVFDAPVAAGLLRRIGVSDVQICGRDLQLASELREFGIDAEPGRPL
jgi:3,4-dihydroxy 2-butanone 4-phosphate synthase / GTP cyclohydrolase II